jgi:hypothetical protein|tara:strand:- start:2401 stop:2670 length:270 start_codon:yes stop_codon:yes gene_type:complete
MTDDELSEALYELIKVSPEKLSPYELTWLLTNLISSYDMEDNWIQIATIANQMIASNVVEKYKKKLNEQTVQTAKKETDDLFKRIKEKK